MLKQALYLYVAFEYNLNTDGFITILMDRVCARIATLVVCNQQHYGADFGFDRTQDALGACRGAVCLYKSRI
jgi:hypothetical protein